jgi:hypothetical protein
MGLEGLKALTAGSHLVLIGSIVAAMRLSSSEKRVDVLGDVA